MVDDALKKIEEQLYNSMNNKPTEKVPVAKNTDKIEIKEEIKEKPKEEVIEKKEEHFDPRL